MKELLKKYVEASNQYVDKEKFNKDVIGIIVSGSIQNSSLDKNSDIDIYVVLDPKCNYRERGNLFINNVEIEYFKNPPAQIESYFEKEDKNPHTAHMLASGKVVYSESTIVDELMSKAKSIMARRPDKLKGTEIELEKYVIDDYYKDLEDALLNKDFIGVKIIRAKIINRSIDIFCRVNQVRREKDKRLCKQLGALDSNFKQLIEKTLNENWNTMTSIGKLRTTIEELLGGRRSSQWKIRSHLDL
ncbi:nucleotidyltransferase domain-containing protein [Muricauda sp. SCSIO 64092]|uniref:nucleotidyltransferase domain-containing protein n=1 Tax=Allomuricauda sp. SCSIO 64092 TaxID=2908842 RepID=UPI001FF39EBB|nr:nucleotidyltransferase domain-containing protein [Muricauda sp. SCSIO 64092]UOY08280.1 nucleotidyltransferase domain-containing protein [Muricauda sp. SCSIO 64092]